MLTIKILFKINSLKKGKKLFIQNTPLKFKSFFQMFKKIK